MNLTMKREKKIMGVNARERFRKNVREKFEMIKERKGNEQIGVVKWESKRVLEGEREVVSSGD